MGWRVKASAKRAIRIACGAAVALVLAARPGDSLASPTARDTTIPRPRAVEIVSRSPEFRLPARHVEFGDAELDRCLGCHGLAGFMVRDSVTRELLRLSVDGPAFRRSAHGKIPCTHCHGEVREFPHRFKTARTRVSCDADCHARDPRGRPLRHERELADFKRGAHRKGLTGENLDDPTCAYCHGAGDAHAITRVAPGLTRAEKMARCATCHEDRERMRRNRIETEAVASYRESFHYKAMRLGSTRTAVCQDCHAVHRVIAPRDTASTVAAGHLAGTCGQKDCHEGARMRFAMSGANHLDVRVRREPLLVAERALFVGVGWGVVAALAAGVALDLRRRLAGRARLSRTAPIAVGEPARSVTGGARAARAPGRE